MSEYAEIVIGKLSLCWFRNYLDGEIVRLFFSKNDLVVFRDCKIDGEEVGTFTKYIYRTTVKRAKERLDALGYGINNFEKTFNNKMFQAIDYSAFLYHLHVDYDEYAQETELRIKKNVTFKKWKNAMRKIINYEVANGNISWHGTVSDVTIRTEG